MPRRTKDDAEKTRNALLNAAEKVFYKKGVSRTTLEQIARAAKVTRGAVYWHFKDKAELLEAMTNRVFLPQEDVLEKLAAKPGPHPLDDLREACADSLQKIATDKQRQRVVSIMMLRCEYTDEMAAVMDRRRDCKNLMLDRLQRLFAAAHRLKMLDKKWPPQLAAISLLSLMSGLINRSLENPGTFDIGKVGAASVTAFIESIQAK